MESALNTRTERTRERLREAALRLFLKQGYVATSVSAILDEAGVSSKETFYRHYAGKEELFADVLSHLTLSEPHFSSKLSEMPAPHDLASLRQALTIFAREVLTMMSQPEYIALLRAIFAEAPRFPQLGQLFRDTITQRGLTMLSDLLRQARERGIIAEVDLEAVTRMLLGGLVTYALTELVFAGKDARPPLLKRADAIVDVVMRALAPHE